MSANVEVTERSWFSRIMSSFMGVIVGIILFIVAFIFLWNTEGRTDMSEIAVESIPVNASSVDASTEGQLVALSGILESDEQLGDKQFLAPGDYLTLDREVEMFAWVEKSDVKTEKEVGGSERTTTEYFYETEWTSRPRASNNFKIKQGHENPALTIEDASFTVKAARIGAYSVDPQQLGLPSSETLSLSPDMVVVPEGQVEGDFLYLGQGTLQNPQVGDVRIQYRAVPAGLNVTAFGKQQGDSLITYRSGDDTLYTAYKGDRENAIAAMASAHRTTGWLRRGLGFVAMWIGLMLILGPISTILDVLPFLGNLSRTVVRLITFGVAFICALITSVVSAVVHNPILLILLLAFVLAVIGVGGFLGYRYMNEQREAAATSS